MPLILPGNVASATASTTYDVDNSCRINRADSPSLTRDQSASPTHDDKGTLSFWFKIGNLSSGDGHYFFSVFTDGDNRIQMYLQSDNTLKLLQKTGASTVLNLVTTRVFRDPGAWYHLVIACDSSQGTAANRIKIYINGVQETSFSTETYLDQNEDIQLVKGTEVCLGAYNKASPSDFLDAYLAEMVLIDGTQNAVTDFGEFDEDSPTIWKPIDVSGLTFGTNGFYLDFEDSADLGDDESGNTNDFTETNLDATDQASDSPTNNFCTLNPLWVSSNTYSEGNTEVAGGGAHRPNIPTMAVSSGKWYMEGKLIAGNTNKWFIGYADQEFYDAQQNQTGNLNWGGGNTAGGTNQINVSVNNGWSNQLNLYPNSAVTSFFSSSSVADDIIGLAVDLDDQKAWWSQNGVWRNGSAAESTTFNASYPDTTQLDAGRNYYIGTGSEDSTWSVNYGNPSFAISSGNADANGYGNMEYAIPDGYYCLCTKNLAEFG